MSRPAVESTPAPVAGIEWYEFFGNWIEVHSSRQELLKEIRRYYQPFHRAVRNGRLQAVFSFSECQARTGDPRQPVLGERDRFRYIDTLRCIRCDFRDSPWSLEIASFFNIDAVPADQLAQVVYPLLLENVLKRLGLVRLHAGSLEKNGQGLLLAGSSGSGKTTTVIALLRKDPAFRFIGDDQVFLQEVGSGVQALGFKRDLFLRDQTVKLFPELEFLNRLPPARGEGRRAKRSLTVHQLKTLYGARTFSQTPVSVLIFPRRCPNQTTRLRALSPMEAISLILQQLGKDRLSILKDPVALENQFKVYTRLVTSARLFSLTIGGRSRADPDEAANLIAQLV